MLLAGKLHHGSYSIMRSLTMMCIAVCILLCSWLPSVSSRLFSPRSRHTGEVIVLLDIQFTLHLVARLDGQEVEARTFTEMDVKHFNLDEKGRGTRRIILDLVFAGSSGADGGYLRYGFFRYDEESAVSFRRYFDLKPKAMFRNVSESASRIEFEDPEIYSKKIGMGYISYVCEENDSLTFRLANKAIKYQYEYEISVNTTHLQVQAFDMRHGDFGPVQWKMCLQQAPQSKTAKSSGETVVIAGVVGGGFFMVLVAMAAILIARRRWKQVSLLVNEDTPFTPIGRSIR